MHPEHMEQDEIRALIAELDANIARETKIRNELQLRLIQWRANKPAAERARKLGWGGLIGRGAIWTGVAGAAGTVRKAAGEMPGAAAAAATATTAALAITGTLLLLPHDDLRQPPRAASQPSASAPARQPTVPPVVRPDQPPDQRSENGQERGPEQPQGFAALPGRSPSTSAHTAPPADVERGEPTPRAPVAVEPSPLPPAAQEPTCIARLQLLDLVDLRLLCRPGQIA